MSLRWSRAMPIALAVLAVLGIGAYYYLNRPPASGEVWHLVPIGSGRALVVRHVPSEWQKSSYVSLVDNDGTKWRRLLPRVATSPRVTVGQSVVLLRHATDDYRIQLRAIDLSTGNTVWTQRPFGDQSDPSAYWAISTPPLYRDGVFYDFFGHMSGSDGTTLIAYDELSGTERWRVKLGPGQLIRAQLINGFLVVNRRPSLGGDSDNLRHQLDARRSPPGGPVDRRCDGQACVW